MHCCPSGSVMAGVNVGGNIFKCAHLGVAVGNPTLDTGTQRNSMLSCPVGYVMRGFTNAQGHLACVTVPSNAPSTRRRFQHPRRVRDDARMRHRDAERRDVRHQRWGESIELRDDGADPVERLRPAPFDRG